MSTHDLILRSAVMEASCKAVADASELENVSVVDALIDAINSVPADTELLEACSNWISWLSPGSPWRDDAADYERSMLDAMRAAIAKATSSCGENG